MESFKIEKLNFLYSNTNKKVLNDINLEINQGEFVVICGKSGCGKTTLLRMLKPSLTPHGDLNGNIYYNGKLLSDYDPMDVVASIGFVLQSPDNQIVTDKVWHELAFGLESLGMNQNEIRTRVSEMASFFGIHKWFHKNTAELSGGQKQLLNLASVMVMQPSVLILDEPTGQLDPIAAGEFLKTLQKINHELGTTIILTEHRLEEVFPMADRVIVMDEGKIIVNAFPAEIGRILTNQNYELFNALPTPLRVYCQIPTDAPCPLTVRDGRLWLEQYSKTNPLYPEKIPADKSGLSTENVIELQNVWYRYQKNSSDILKGFELSVKKGELFCIVGGNGTGKTTALSVISGLYAPYRGSVKIKGQFISEIDRLYEGIMAFLPQNPQSIFVKKTLFLDLMDMLSESKLSPEEKTFKIQNVSSLCRIEKLLERHPYDLSGGEQQRAALAKILLTEPEILLLDEPTKGMDANFKEEFSYILKELKDSGVTVVMVSHDIEFCAQYADRCALVFDGNITSVGSPREFFKGKSFYTTSANRMARTCLPDAILAEDIILACGGQIKKRNNNSRALELYNLNKEPKLPKTPQKNNYTGKVVGSIFILLFLITSIFSVTGGNLFGTELTGPLISVILRIACVIEFLIICLCFFPSGSNPILIRRSRQRSKNYAAKWIVATIVALVVIPLTVLAGVYLFGDRKYYFICLLIIIETIIPFSMMFETRKPQARELVVISVLCAVGVAGRATFYALPQFKPVVAIIIISAVCFGGETGFLVGALTGFVSNLFVGQGPWTPWQMFALGIIGFITGILFYKGIPGNARLSLSVYGFFITLIVYGGIMNPASVIMAQSNITWKMILASYVVALPLDLIHAMASAFFLWFISEPMIEKLERIKVKYGLVKC